MKKLFLVVAIFSFGLLASAQISEGGFPPSYKTITTKSSISIPKYTLPELDTTDLLEWNQEHNLPLRYAVLENVSVDLKSVATKTTLTDGSAIWQYRIESPNGKSVQIIFSKYMVPEGAELYLYNNDYENVRGAYGAINMTENLTFVTGDFPDNYVIIEYYEPANVAFSGELVIGAIGQSYIDVFDTKSKNTDDDGYISVNCDEGIEWQNQKHAVCKYSFNDTKYSYLCSGSLINTTKSDGTPYFLTASHCISSESEAETVVAYFNYENSSCEVLSPYVTQSLSGAILVTTGSLSDYTLLLLNDNVPSSYQPFFPGWDVSGTAAENTVSIHHPGGTRKRISIDNDTAVSYEKTISWDEGDASPAGTHWQVTFDEGLTGSGSSGGPLFDQNKRIIGQLHGGSDATDYYGKLNYSWNHPNDQFSKLKSYLDPDNSGVTSLNGYYPSDNLPDAKFVSDFSAVCVNSPIPLTGFSAFDPQAWQWSFSPSTVEYSNGTNENSQLPSVSFTVQGTYTVSLTVTNSAGTDAITVNSFITAGSVLSLEAYPLGLSDSCTCSFNNMEYQAYGADVYNWTLTDGSDNYFYIADNTANPAEIYLKDGVELTESTDINLTLTGTQGTCEKTIQLTIPLEAQPNDDIENAIAIQTGKNGTYSNSCATVEENEPVPPCESCTGQLSWCDEYGTGENIVEHSVWFYFTPSVNQTISLSSTGFDNEIAIYKADSWQDVLSGNYNMVAANDDYSATNYNPTIISLAVTAGQNYWVQVDGSAGGVTGTFSLTLSVLSSINDISQTDEEINVYPLPAEDFVNIECESFAGCENIQVELFNINGEKVYEYSLSEVSGTIKLPLDNLPSGIYIARLIYDDKVSVVKIIK